MKKKANFMCTAFRDGFQSVFGARVLTKDFLPALDATRDAGITWFEAGGGARFQSLYFYCREDAFAMMDTFRQTVGPDADLQTLARGVNVVGLESQSSDVIRLHAELFKKHGMTTIRNFDALNDVENLIYSGRCIVDAGLKHQVCVTMMELPPGCEGAHDPDFYEKTLRAILDAEIPFDAVCFKDASGTAVPSKVYATIRRARKLLPEGAYIHFHTHETAGVSVMANRAALDAGADAIDLSMAPVSGGTSQPDILTMWHALRGTEYDLDIDVDKVLKAEQVFRDCMKEYFIPPEALAVEPLIPWSPMPGGALTANTQMMRDHGILSRYGETIAAMSEVVRRGGFGTSVTPVSQFYFQQAFNNVMFGPWKKIAEPYGQMVLGYFGKTPVPPDPEIVRLASEQLGLEPTTEPPLQRNDADPTKGLEPARAELKKEGIAETEENLFIAATCKEKGIAFLKGEGQLSVRKNVEEAKPAPSAALATKTATDRYAVRVNSKTYMVNVEGSDLVIAGQRYAVTLVDDEGADEAPAEGAAGEDVKAHMPGQVLRVAVAEGDSVESGQTVLVLEAMKMEMAVTAPHAGRIASLLVKPGQQVAEGQTLMTMVR